MQVILTTPEEIEIRLTAPWEEARKLQRPLPPGFLQVVATGSNEEPPPSTPQELQPSLF
jgi:putative SOS response-associated peptidase YedK